MKYSAFTKKQWITWGAISLLVLPYAVDVGTKAYGWYAGSQEKKAAEASKSAQAIADHFARLDAATQHLSSVDNITVAQLKALQEKLESIHTDMREGFKRIDRRLDMHTAAVSNE
jgi:hypothetical protein